MNEEVKLNRRKKGKNGERKLVRKGKESKLEEMADQWME